MLTECSITEHRLESIEKRLENLELAFPRSQEEEMALRQIKLNARLAVLLRSIGCTDVAQV